MTVHTIRLPDRMHGRELRTVIWDDEAGSVSGDHFDVGWMQEALQHLPVDLTNEGRVLVLRDPAHDPRDFIHLLAACWGDVLAEDRDLLPEPLRSVDPTPILPPPGVVQDPDGTWRPMYDDMVF